MLRPCDLDATLRLRRLGLVEMLEDVKPVLELAIGFPDYVQVRRVGGPPVTQLVTDPSAAPPTDPR